MSLGVVTLMLISVLETLGSMTMPIRVTRHTQNANSTTTAPRGASLWSRHHSRLAAYLAWTFSNQGMGFTLASRRMVEAEAGTTVMATSREAIRQ